jgi:DNA-directed RNA polymerase subunit RPC12/RpoP
MKRFLDGNFKIQNEEDKMYMKLGAEEKKGFIRPDHYKCLDCGYQFNDAKFIRKQAQGIHSAQASCPNCSSTKIKISWWKKKENR